MMRSMLGVLGLLVAGCAAVSGTTGGASGAAEVRATLHDASGRPVGEAKLQQAGDGIRIGLQAGGLPAGTHGVHIHAVGRCDPPDFASAGPHWNPTGRQHGKDNPAGMHHGDLPNMTADADGRGDLTATAVSASLTGLLDADGAAIVIHAAADDYRTDPSGNSGARIACGVLSAS